MGGVLRKWAVGDMLNEDIDDFPAELWPLQKSKNRPFDFTTLSDARNNGFSEYAFALAWKGYTIAIYPGRYTPGHFKGCKYGPEQ